MQSMRVLEMPPHNGAAVRLSPHTRMPTPLAEPEPLRRKGCRGCGGQQEAPGNQAQTVAPQPTDAHWQELQGRFAMLDWLERGLARLRQEIGEGGAWGRFMLRQAVEGTLEAIEETMLQCDALRGFVVAGGGRSNGTACALTRAYDSLEERLRLHMGMERQLQAEGVG